MSMRWFLVFLVGCFTPSYGSPQPDTIIDVHLSGGLVARDETQIRIVGSTVTFGWEHQTEQVAIAPARVAEIIHALEEVRFLSLDDDTRCAVSDGFYYTISVRLPAGKARVRFAASCSKLSDLELRISKLSGYDDWVRPRNSEIVVRRNSGGIPAPSVETIRISGSMVTFTSEHHDGRTDQRPIAPARVASILRALDDAKFATIEPEPRACTDAYEYVITVGTKAVSFAPDCPPSNGAVLLALEGRISTISGYADWLVQER